MGVDVSIRVGSTQADDLSAVTHVEVHERIGEPTTYRLRYMLTDSGGDFPLLTDGRLDPGSTLAVAVPIGTGAVVLVKGEVHAQRVHVEHGAASSWLEVIGADGTLAMDRDIQQRAWPAQQVSDSIFGLLSSAKFTPHVDPISVTTSEENHVLVQAETDLRFVRRLARRYGHWFWVAVDDADVTHAYFQRPQLTTPPKITLGFNQVEVNGTTVPNFSALDLEWDVERPNTAIGSQLGGRDKVVIDGQVARSPLPSLGDLALADIAAARTVHVVAPVDDVGDLRTRAEGALIEAEWFIRARGQTTKYALGDVLRTHTTVALAGMGARHSGTYVVASVRHVITSTAHTMHFELARNGWGAA